MNKVTRVRRESKEELDELLEQGWVITYEGKTGYTLEIDDELFGEIEEDVEFKAYIKWEHGESSSYEHINSIGELREWVDRMEDY